MATLRVHLPSGETATLQGQLSFSLLNQLLGQGISLPHDCGGRARCGTCRVGVLTGAEGLAPSHPGPAEAERLAAIGAGPEERLACQIRFYKDLEIELKGRRPEA